jgi:hypothetical protein
MIKSLTVVPRASLLLLEEKLRIDRGAACV